MRRLVRVVHRRDSRAVKGVGLTAGSQGRGSAGSCRRDRAGWWRPRPPASARLCRSPGRSPAAVRPSRADAAPSRDRPSAALGKARWGAAGHFERPNLAGIVGAHADPGTPRQRRQPPEFLPADPTDPGVTTFWLSSAPDLSRNRHASSSARLDPAPALSAMSTNADPGAVVIQSVWLLRWRSRY